MTEAPARLTQLVIGGPVDPWRRLGLRFDADQHVLIGAVTVRIEDAAPPGIRGWVFDRPLSSIDGLQTSDAVPQRSEPSPDFCSIDHVVVMTDSMERTSGALTEVAGIPQRRVRDAGDGVVQAFHRSGEVIIEVVQTSRSLQPTLWGFVLVAPAFDEIVSRLGESVFSAPKPAVQPGRRIATVRREVGLGVNVAVITPDQ